MLFLVSFLSFLIILSFRKLYGQYNVIVIKYNISQCRILTDVFHIYGWAIIYHRIVYEFFCFLDYENEHTAGLMGKQGCYILHRT